MDIPPISGTFWERKTKSKAASKAYIKGKKKKKTIKATFENL